MAVASSPAPGLIWKRLLMALLATSVSPLVAISVSGPEPPTSELKPESPCRIDGPDPPTSVTLLASATSSTGTVEGRLVASILMPEVSATAKTCCEVGGDVSVMFAVATWKLVVVVAVFPKLSVTITFTESLPRLLVLSENVKLAPVCAESAWLRYHLKVYVPFDPGSVTLAVRFWVNDAEL